jgi:5-methylcytosine-specific restriction endonuclease McrA
MIISDMKIESFDDFRAYFEKYRRFPNNSYVKDKPYTEAQLKTKYQSYLRSEEKAERRMEEYTEIDEEWVRVSKIVWERDGECRLCQILSPAEKRLFAKTNISYDATNCEVAHIIPRPSSKKLYYEPDNLVLLFSAFHRFIDNKCDPLTGKYFGDTTPIWERIVGKEYLQNLKERM